MYVVSKRLFSFVFNFVKMPRIKEYNESDVLEKAMNLFWRNGFETTSMHMLEKEMGINKFSIYSSFGSKQGLLLASIKCYQEQLNSLLTEIEKGKNGKQAIKNYFYKFLSFSQRGNNKNGCLITNTKNELGDKAAPEIKNALVNFTLGVKDIFANALSKDSSRTVETINQQSDYLLIAMFGLSSASRVFDRDQLENYIEQIFNSI